MNTKDPAVHSYCVCDVSGLVEHQIFCTKAKVLLFQVLGGPIDYKGPSIALLLCVWR